ncbi:MAG: hypothetical protein Q7R52_00485 [archaeon]|nr:hypothetical protein [archaeon]
MNKRGQFYLFAAIIIIGIILGFATISNSINATRDDTKVTELADAINIELGKVMEYQKIEDSGKTTEELLMEFTRNYANQYAHKQRTTYFVYVFTDTEEKFAFKYEEVSTGNWVLVKDETIIVNIETTTYDVTILGRTQTFNIDTNNPEKTTYFVIYELDKNNEGNNAWVNR